MAEKREVLKRYLPGFLFISEVYQMGYSSHAITRMRQRAIEPLAIDLVCKYGVATRKHHATVFMLDKKARKHLNKDMGRECISRISDKLNIGVVVADDGDVVTAFHRTKRIHD